MKKEILFKLDIMKIDMAHQRNKWNKLKEEINNVKPSDNYGTEAIDRAFVDMLASIDYSKFLMKG